MKFLRNYIDKIKPHFEDGGNLHVFHSVFDGFDSFLFVPHETSKVGVNIHDAIDSKRIMSIVVIALLPAVLFGMYNVGFQNYTAAGTLVQTSFWEVFFFGFLALLPNILVSYIVGLGIEFIVAQFKHEEIQEGYLVSGMIIPLILPVTIPLWMLALAVAFAVIFAKEIFGGTGRNLLNVAIVARAFLFFSYPTKMAGGNEVWVSSHSIFGLGNDLPDTFSGATPLGQLGQGHSPDSSMLDSIIGLIPGCVGETSVIAIAIGAVILLWTGIASWRTMGSVFVGGALTALLFNNIGLESNMVANTPWYQHLILGGFCFGAVFMATDPVTSCRTSCGQYVYGFLIGVVAIVVRVLNPGYPEGMMLAIFLMNVFAPLIDHCVVSSNIRRRMNRMKGK